jgi:hypothetical protein
MVQRAKIVARDHGLDTRVWNIENRVFESSDFYIVEVRRRDSEYCPGGYALVFFDKERNPVALRVVD